MGSGLKDSIELFLGENEIEDVIEINHVEENLEKNVQNINILFLHNFGHTGFFMKVYFKLRPKVLS